MSYFIIKQNKEEQYNKYCIDSHNLIYKEYDNLNTQKIKVLMKPEA